MKQSNDQELINKFHLALEEKDYFLVSVLKKRLETLGYRVIEKTEILPQFRQNNEIDRQSKDV